MAEIWGIAAATVAAGVGGAIISSNGAQSAAQTSANAAESATQAQLQMFNTTQADYAPQVQLGQGAANMLGGIYGIGGVSGVPGSSAPTSGSPSPNYAAFYNSPGYQFSLSQGQAAINKQAAASGNLYSSGTLAAQNNYAQGVASTQYNNYINQLTTMAGLGNTASAGVGAAATATGQGVASSLQNAGNASAAGILGSSNAFSNALGSVSNGIGNTLLLRGLNGGGFGGVGSGTAPIGTEVTGGVDPAFNTGNSGIYSDSSCKQFLQEVGRDRRSELRVYDFWYVGEDTSEPRHRGYIAQEVREKYPHAVSRGVRGFLKVDYSLIPSEHPYPLRIPTEREWAALETLEDSHDA